MLNLASATDRGWVERAIAGIDEVLLDHAHCEKKAASTAVNLLFRYPERGKLLRPLACLAREELAHFEEVLAVLEERGLTMRRQVPSPYAGKLLAAVRATEPERLLDTLLCLSLIEARSCERMQLLAGALGDQRLADLYRGLLAREARHHQIYVRLACSIVDRGEAHARLAELARHEAAVIAAAPDWPRLHN